jgi:hypothetical protein
MLVNGQESATGILYNKCPDDLTLALEGRHLGWRSGKHICDKTVNPRGLY